MKKFRKEFPMHMHSSDGCRGGENFDLRQVLLRGRSLTLSEKTGLFGEFLRNLDSRRENFCLRPVASAADREVTIVDPATGLMKSMLMFGSNNYLGLANHPLVRERAQQAIRRFGVGVGGPPLLNGYTILHRELEERLADLKGTESALLFSSGYGANVGVLTGLLNSGDTVVYDEYSHASFCDGLKMAGARSVRFPHNDVDTCSRLLGSRHPEGRSDTYLGVEGVYSMDGDCAPLDRLIPLCRSHGTILVLDDAHGTGVLGEHGRGTAEHFGLEGSVDITVGTFSKTFAATGGFVAASKAIVEYLRYFARSYMFSASLPPVVVATVLACLDVLEKEPGLLISLRENIRYAGRLLRPFGAGSEPAGAIIPLRVAPGMNIRAMARKFHELGIFLNSVEYPAVPVTSQRFRISLMATHTKADIDRLASVAGMVWDEARRSVEISDTGEMISHELQGGKDE
jgi:glycine C-acetyltransferase